MSITDTKSQARKQAAIIRETAHAELAETAKDILTKTSLSFLGCDLTAKSVSGFIPYRSEIDVTPLLGALSKKGCTTCLPIVTGQGQPLVFRQWQPGDKTEPGAWNIPVPLQSATPIEPDILLVPLLAFDSAGYRLGYGGGFYDRTIEKLGKKKPIITIGVAYSAQQITNVPTDKHDQQLDWILTEKGPVKCG